MIDQTQILDSIIASLPASTKYHDGPTTLQHLFHALINHLKAQPEAKLFLVPIETSNIKLIPKYLMTVSRVIDFTTINNKLEKEEYDSMWSLIEDVKGMTDSICRYFRKNFTIFKCAKKVTT